MDRIILAADFAARKHRDDRRKDPEQTPYINHPIGVAKILTDEGNITGMVRSSEKRVSDGFQS